MLLQYNASLLLKDEEDELTVNLEPAVAEAGEVKTNGNRHHTINGVPATLREGVHDLRNLSFWKEEVEHTLRNAEPSYERDQACRKRGPVVVQVYEDKTEEKGDGTGNNLGKALFGDCHDSRHDVAAVKEDGDARDEHVEPEHLREKHREFHSG